MSNGRRLTPSMAYDDEGKPHHHHSASGMIVFAHVFEVILILAALGIAIGALVVGVNKFGNGNKWLSIGVDDPANTNRGAFTTTYAAPASQAFGAVTANAASGLLTFTVSTAAVTCATGVVTNTHVKASSQVFLSIQDYTGTPFTNGDPTVTRQDTAGSAAGSFTIRLCNRHATNALSGSLYVAFWVLN